MDLWFTEAERKKLLAERDRLAERLERFKHLIGPMDFPRVERVAELEAQVVRLKKLVIAFEKDESLVELKAQCDRLKGALEKIAAVNCHEPWGVPCSKLLKHEHDCEPCIAMKALEE